MKSKFTFLLIILIIAILFLVYIFIDFYEYTKNPPGDPPYISYISENLKEDKYIIIEQEYDIATHGGDPILKPVSRNFKNISKQKTLNARLNMFNETVTMDLQTSLNRQLYDRYEIRQLNCYLFSCQYFTAFDTTSSNRGVNMLVGSDTTGTLLINLLALMGTDLDSKAWEDFMVIFNEAREDAGTKEITKDQLASDNTGYVFIGDDLTDLTLLILYKAPDDTQQQEVSLKLNDIMDCFTEKMQANFTFTKDASMTFDEYLIILSEYEE